MEKKQGFTHDNKNNMTVDWYTPPSILMKPFLCCDADINKIQFPVLVLPKIDGVKDAPRFSRFVGFRVEEDR